MRDDKGKTNELQDTKRADEWLEEIMVEYGRDVLHLAFSYVKDKSLAEDMAQEIFIKCYDHLDSFRWNSSLKTWIYRITVNHCKDYLKSWHYRKMTVTQYVEQWIRTSSVGAEQAFLRQDENAELLKQVISLPIKYREMIFFHYYEEMTVKEMAELLELNMNTVKSRLTKARQLLKEALEEEETKHGSSIETAEKSNE